MTPERWQQVDKLFEQALEKEPDRRGPFLDEACVGDAELRQEVESLLAYDRQARQFINQPALQLAAEKVASEPPSLVGRKLGPYQIQSVLGAGGMGEVYKAKDTRLNRSVAIKGLPRYLSERADLRQRFEREARAIAGLNHPNICGLHDLGRGEGIDFLVMEYVEGETLSQRLRKGPLPTEQLLRTAVEIATALDQAHRQGVVHRDLKPGNIMLTKTGAKLLDFGLAKNQALSPLVRSATGGQDAGKPAAGTETKSLTEEGMILGTLEYMAPEQVEGKEMDARTDIFAFGVVLYEMATGKKAFEGDSKPSLTAAILTAEPPPIVTVQLTPAALDRVVRGCLAKDPEERWQTVRDLTRELKWIAEAGGIPGEAAGAESAGLWSIARGRRRERLAWVLVMVLVAAAILSVERYLHQAGAPARAIFSDILPPEKTQFNFGWEAGGPTLSPDGTAVAFSAKDANGKTQLWIRSLDLLAARPLAGTEGGIFPFWSPQGRRLGFFADGKLK